MVVVAPACGREPDTTPPVATPSIALSRSEAPVGSPIDVTFRFAIVPDAPRFTDDYWVFVHFVNDNGDLIWTEDHAPPTPTRDWMPGATVEYARTMFIPRVPDETTLTIELGLFSPRTGERLPLAAPTEGDRAYRVGALGLRLETPVVVAFARGWHDVEVSEDALGVEWQWSMGAGVVSFPNPSRDVEFYLQVDQPVVLPEGPQQVQVAIGGTMVDRFALPPGEALIRRLSLTPEQLGTGDTVDVTISVDRTFVPAALQGLNNPDTRRLGVRVFRAYVRPV